MVYSCTSSSTGPPNGRLCRLFKKILNFKSTRSQEGTVNPPDHSYYIVVCHQTTFMLLAVFSVFACVLSFLVRRYYAEVKSFSRRRLGIRGLLDVKDCCEMSSLEAPTSCSSDNRRRSFRTRPALQANWWASLMDRQGLQGRKLTKGTTMLPRTAQQRRSDAPPPEPSLAQ